MTGSKRFISGAVCPSCQAVDRIVIETLAADEGLDPILVCGVRRARPAAGAAGRVSRTARTRLPQQQPIKKTSTTEDLSLIHI